MNIICANNYHYVRGGAERVYFDELSLLEREGHRLASFAMHHPNNLPSAFSKFFAPPIAYDDVSLLQKILVSPKLVYSAENIRKFRSLVEEFAPDILHCHNTYGRITTSILDVAKTYDLPTVMTLHDYKLVCPSYQMLKGGNVCFKCKNRHFFQCVTNKCHRDSYCSSLVYTLEAYFNNMLQKYNSIDYFLCPSKFLLQKHLEAGWPCEKLVHVPNFIDIPSFTPDYEAGAYVLYAGRLSHEKGISTLIQAARGLSVPIKIVGDGPLRATLESEAADLPHVEFLGYRTGDELKQIFAKAAFLVFPSEWYENAPMTILEAFACGKPVLGSNIGGIPEMIEEGETGFFFENRNVAELRKALSEMFADKTLLSQMGHRARGYVEAHHSDTAHYQHLSDVYAKAIANKRCKTAC